MTTYFFILTLILPVFGGPVDMTFRFSTLDGCERFRVIVERKLGSDFSIDVTPGNKKGHSIKPEAGCLSSPVTPPGKNKK